MLIRSLNDLELKDRLLFLEDMSKIGDALLEVTGAARINYEILGNSEPELHAHVFPRFANEPAELRRKPAWSYDWENAVSYSAKEHGQLHQQLRLRLRTAA